MKNIFVSLLFLLSLNLFAQDNEPAKMFSTIKLGALAGVNFSSLSGGSFVLEGRTNLTSDLNLTLSFGYSTINKKEGYNVKTNTFITFDNFNQYATESYNVDELNYDVFPISLGLEYYFQHSVFSPYVLVEAGYNFYSFHQTQSGGAIGADGFFAAFNQLPETYQGTPPLISKDNSYRIAVGAGTTYKLSRFINLDVRYLYQYNKSIVNTNQILVGINF